MPALRELHVKAGGRGVRSRGRRQSPLSRASMTMACYRTDKGTPRVLLPSRLECYDEITTALHRYAALRLDMPARNLQHCEVRYSG